MSDSADTQVDSQPDVNPPSTAETFNLLVKNPTDRPGAPQFTVNVDVKSTVRQVKELLSRSYPGSPNVSSQRLIYAGKLLNDSHVLESVMASCDRSVQHTVHLVVSSMHRSSASISGSSASSSAAQPSSAMRSQAQSANPAQTPTGPPRQPHPAAGHPQNFGNMFNPYIAFQQYAPGMDGQRFFYPPIPGIAPHDPAAYHMPYAPQYPPYPPLPSDNPANGQHRNMATGTSRPFAPVDPSAYAAHLQVMERMIADSLAAQQNNAQEAAVAAAAHGTAEGADARAAAQAAASAAAAMHAQAHVQAMANLDAGLRAQLENNQAAPHMQNPIPAQGVGYGFPFGRGNGAMDGAHQHEHQNPNQAIGEGAPRVRRFVFQFEINWSLISKLIFVVYLLGQEGSPRRVYTLMTIALAIYLWQTNRLGFLRRIAGVALPNPVQLFESLFPREDPSDVGDAGPSDAQQAPAVSRPRVRNRFGRVAVILCFVYSFFYGFVSSLLPAWRPQPLPRMDELLNPQPNENANNQSSEAATEDENLQDIQHEHAD